MDVRTVRRGSGEPYVLIHGIGSHAEVWSPVMDALASRFSVVAVDLPGFGQSPAQVPAPDHRAPGRRLRRLAARRGAGGLPCRRQLDGRARCRSSCRGVEWCAARSRWRPAGFWTPQERRWCQDSLARAKKQIRLLRPVLPAIAGTAAGRTAFGWQVFGRPWAVPEQQMLATADALLAADAFDEALALFDDYTFHDAEQLDAVPVMVVWVSRHRLLLSRQAARARRVLPNARHEWLTGAGHLPMWDAPRTRLRGRGWFGSAMPGLGQSRRHATVGRGPRVALGRGGRDARGADRRRGERRGDDDHQEGDRLDDDAEGVAGHGIAETMMPPAMQEMFAAVPVIAMTGTASRS